MQSGTRTGEEQFTGRYNIQKSLQCFHDMARITLPGKFTEQLLEMSESLQGTQIPRVGCHGDFWPGNILVADNALGVIDWEDFRHCPNPFYDFFQFVILHAQVYPWRGWQTVPHEESFWNAVLKKNWYSNMILGFTQDLMGKLRIPDQYAHLLFSLYLLEQATPTAQQGVKRYQQAGLWQKRLGWYANHYQESIFLIR
jgi:hypothetical protein